MSTKDNAVHTIYKTKDGTRVPSVTTYLGILGKPAIIHWAWELGTQGLDYRKVRDQSGDIGTWVHSLILGEIMGESSALAPFTEQELATCAIPMEKWHKWFSDHELVPSVCETPMVSEKYRYGGTPDFYGLIDGKKTLLDFKTSGAIYPENFYQLAAYKKLLEEFGYKVDEVAVLRIGKTADEGFEYREAGNLEPAWEIFLACQKIYELQKTARKVK